MRKELPIEKIKAYLCQIEIGCKYATHELNTASSLIVELLSGEHTGWGEVFLPKIEPQWTWLDTVAPLLLTQDATAMDGLLYSWPQKQRPKMQLSDCSTYCHPDVDLVAEAVSFALYDLCAKSKGIPLRAPWGFKLMLTTVTQP
jgi:L-alanine-DL-glutamate epimerase-like enolase superfamily enzyme